MCPFHILSFSCGKCNETVRYSWSIGLFLSISVSIYLSQSHCKEKWPKLLKSVCLIQLSRNCFHSKMIWLCYSICPPAKVINDYLKGNKNSFAWNTRSMQIQCLSTSTMRIFREYICIMHLSKCHTCACYWCIQASNLVVRTNKESKI
jgi:hypothetical protein